MDNQQILNYGGGRQTAAMVAMIVQGLLEKPDRIVIADTGREKSSTWDYLSEVIQPMLATIGMQVEVAPRRLAYVDLYGHNGDLLLPVYTMTGKLPAFCSSEWKQSVVSRYLKLTALGHNLAAIDAMSYEDIRTAMRQTVTNTTTNWIGFAFDERQRVKGEIGRRYPLIDMMMTKADCRAFLDKTGLPIPPPSSCYMCPNMSNAEWRYVRDTYPADFAQAIVIDDDVRAEDIARGSSGVWLHKSRVPLRDADLDVDDGIAEGRQCGMGLCYV